MATALFGDVYKKFFQSFVIDIAEVHIEKLYALSGPTWSGRRRYDLIQRAERQ
jgi:hypothetical protein